MSPHFALNKCEICNKEIRKGAEFCSICRRPYHYMEEKNPTATRDELIKLTRNYIQERNTKTNLRRQKTQVDVTTYLDIPSETDSINLKFTPQLINASSLFFRDELRQKARESYKEFTEFKSTTIKFGVRTSSLAVAHTNGYTVDTPVIFIGINPEHPITYNTLGHELTHFLQRITEIPLGEKSCDIWTLARSKLFTDEQPYYLELPSPIRKNWDDYKHNVRNLCIQSIEIRETKRQYIKWLELECKKL